ncbi:uncharacterized protein F13E9.13, mitochondrial [Diabrotica virgifera virgifera]|uniref:Uncharacterized protein n=1 Tax=Diabrotica virgifera virgifera TaxID=50390 RepID=A0ABM5L5Z4_DIAVI|nr:uncharacterized protein F13E9.13, mitochondrial [Diabrotica virgifera virgifera]
MNKFRQLFGKSLSVIGMVHVKALPGTPLFSGSINSIVKKACEETELYLKHDVDGILVENMHDVPYIQSQHFGPEVTATMSRICAELRRIIPKTKAFGVQVLACGNKEALAIAKACSMDFIRAEGFVFSHVADEGFTDANAGNILRYRKSIEADNVLVFTDIKKKHSSHAITNDISLVETAKAADFFLSNGVILTGTATGHAADIKELQQLKSSISLPVLIGSGVTYENLENYKSADALIVGSYFKKDGKWDQEIDENRLSKFMEKMKSLC